MDLLAVEKDIIAKLKNDISIDGVRIASYPQNPLLDYPFNDPNGAILVRYNGSVYDKPIPNRNRTVTQQRAAQWAIYVIYRNLFNTPDDPGHNKSDDSAGVYVWFDLVKNALLGYTVGTQSGSPVNDSKVMYLINDRVLDREDGVWYYEMIFEHETPEVES